jgi:outer membrane lipoprotein LolB
MLGVLGRGRGVGSAIVCAAAAALATGCATRPAQPERVPPGTIADVAFEVAGRLSARHGDAAATAQFTWTHAPGRDELTLATPLGQGLARLAGASGRVRVDFADGRWAEAVDWTTLTASALGAPVPVDGLAWWIRGAPHPGSAHSLEGDGAGRASVLRQDGWEIVLSYPDEAASRPSRLWLRYPEVDVRIVVDAWLAG